MGEHHFIANYDDYENLDLDVLEDCRLRMRADAIRAAESSGMPTQDLLAQERQ